MPNHVVRRFQTHLGVIAIHVRPNLELSGLRGFIAQRPATDGSEVERRVRNMLLGFALKP